MNHKKVTKVSSSHLALAFNSLQRTNPPNKAYCLAHYNITIPALWGAPSLSKSQYKVAEIPTHVEDGTYKNHIVNVSRRCFRKAQLLNKTTMEN